MANSKFTKVSDQYLQKLLETKNSVNTQRVKKNVAVFREYLSPLFLEYHKSDLNDSLRRSFALIRCKLGTNVKTSTLNSYKYRISAIVLKTGLNGQQCRPRSDMSQYLESLWCGSYDTWLVSLKSCYSMCFLFPSIV